MNPATRIGPCAVYIRVSTQGQATDDHVSLDVQREQCIAYVERQGWEIIGDEHTGDTVFLDVRSGLETEKRDAYQRLLTLARSKQITTILVWRYDRFGRDDGELIVRYAELTRLNVKLISATEGEHQPVMFKFAAIMQYEESKRISERVKPAMAKRSEDGLWAGRIPYGYVSAGRRTGLMVEDGYNAQIVQTLFRRYAASESLYSLTRWLNTDAGEHGGPLASPIDSLWRSETVRNMLLNVAYIGKRRVGWESHSRITGRFRRNPAARIVQARQVPLIDEETFWQVNARLSAIPHGQRVTKKRQWLLTSLVYCQECGFRMSGEWNTDHRRIGLRLSNYRCKNRHLNCSTRWVDQAVLDAVASLPLSKADIEQASAMFSARTAKAPEKTADLRSVRAQLDRRLSAATTLVLDGTLSPAVYRKQREALEAEISRLDAELAKLTAPTKSADRVLKQLAEWLAEAGDIGSILAEGDLEERASVIAGAVEKVMLGKNRQMEIVWRPWAEALREGAKPP